MAPIVLNSMKIFVVIFLICLVLVGTVSAKAAPSSAASQIANPSLPSSIYTSAVIDCSDTDASSGTTASMGELSVSSVPAGASISIDGSPWQVDSCIHIPYDGYHCFPIEARSPAFGTVDTGIHPIVISKEGYNIFSGKVKICPQKVTYVDKTLTAVPTTTLTTTVTTTTATTTATTAVTTSAATTTTSAAATTAAATTSATGTATTAAAPATTPPVSETAMPPGTGSLSVTTTPAGAAVYLDGVQRGVSPATIPGLAAGSHTLLLKLNGYQDLSTPVSITAGVANEFSTGLTPLPAAGTPVPPAATAAGLPALPAKTQSPGFEAAAVLSVTGALILFRKF
jgi:PEGA domain